MPPFSDLFQPSGGRGQKGTKSTLGPRLARARRRAAKAGASFLLVLLSVSLISLPPAARAQEEQPQPFRVSNQLEKRAPAEFVPGEVLVRFRSEEAAELSESEPAAELPVGRGRIPFRTERFDGSGIVKGLRLVHVPADDTLEAVKALNARPDVLYAEPNYVRRKLATPNDARFGEMWGLKNTGQPGTSGGNPGTVGADIDAEPAWNLTQGSRSVVVGVIDEGVDVSHPDLAANVWKNPAEVANNSIDDDSNGFIDDVNGWDFFHNDKKVFDGSGAYPSDDTDSHGTHVAGTIGAVGSNGVGVVGVNWQVSLMSLKILGKDGETPAPSSVRLTVRAYNYAKMMRDLWVSSGGAKGANVRVLNNSYGGAGRSQAELDAINALNTSGILFVAAAGNDSSNNDVLPAYPASYQAPNVISVAATTNTDTRSSFTNFGPRTVSMAAPGSWILSTTPNGTYSFFSGTSMASPHVAGAAALVCAASPNITVKRLRAALMYSGDVLTVQNFYASLVSGRRLNALKALQNAAENDTTAPAAVGNFQTGSPVGRKFSLSWTAPGDNASTGQAALYEIRYSDTQPTTPEQFEQATRFIAPLPAVAGTSQSASVETPFRHTSGFISIRAIDNVGNAGPIVSAPVTIQASAADPYVVSVEAAAPLSTGGTPLGLNGDDIYGDGVSLPFVFPFIEGSFSSLSVSTNGALYLPTSPSAAGEPLNDADSSVAGLSGYKMIAGLWDDLRTDQRAGDDVYIVKPDANRVIFRWQAVTYDTPLSATTSRGENPVNFEIELNRNGVVKVRYGAGNQKIWPVVGISGGAPDAYAVMTHTSENSFKSLAGAQTVVFTPRAVAAPQANISSLTVTPTSVVAGKTATGKVTLAAAAPTGGVVVNLSDDLTQTTMPASITIPAGRTYGTFSITTAYTGSAALTGHATAKSGTSTATATFTVLPLAPASLALSPNSVAGGNTVTGTVTLNGPAPASGAVVTLSDNVAATTVPASVTVPAGATKKTFTITTAVVTAKQAGTVTASLHGVNKSASLTVRPVGVLSVSLTPNPVKGGSSMTGTVVLERAAPSNLTVTLKEAVASATAPLSVVVPAGATSKTFTVTTTAVTATEQGTLTAIANATAKSVVFSVTP